jgi:hypothetical protein
MSQPAKVQEPSMEEILASIRRIIADDETKPAATGEGTVASAKPASSVAVPKGPSAMNNPPMPPAPPAVKPAVVEKNSQDDIDALLAGLDSSTTEAEIRPSAPANDVLELTDEMALPDLPETTFQKVEQENDIEFTEVAMSSERHRPSEPEGYPAAEPPSYRESMASPSPQMLSQSTVSAVESAFSTLANTVLSNNARTLEDLVREMLRPMLKSWLDDNLPGLVERIVKAEIERVSRGR